MLTNVSAMNDEVSSMEYDTRSVQGLSVVLSTKLNKMMLNTAKELAKIAVNECATRYGFDGETAIRDLGLDMVTVQNKKKSKKDKSVNKRTKTAIPLPYNGESTPLCCNALEKNYGLYTQCENKNESGSPYCVSCNATMVKKGENTPQYGTIQDRQAVGIMEYVDPKGRKPVEFLKAIKKLNISEEQVRTEAEKRNIQINEIHFTAISSKRGRKPKSTAEKPEKTTTGKKGRPAKKNKTLVIEGENEDIFSFNVASLVDIAANVNAGKYNSSDEESSDEAENDEEKVAKKAEKEAKKAEKEAEKAAKEAKKAEKEAEKAAKEAKKAEKEAEKAAKEAAKEAEKAAKEAAKEAEKAAKKAEKEAAKEAEKAAKEAAKKAEKEVKKQEETVSDDDSDDEEEEDVCKAITYKDKRYLQSKKSGIIYDYAEYKADGNLVKLGKWNEEQKRIDFEEDDNSSDEEEEEDEYEE